MQESSSLDGAKLTAELQKQTEWNKAVIFSETKIIATKSCNPKFEQLTAYFKAYESRDNTIGQGFMLMGDHYDVHRFHPPLVYGRRGNAENGEGISLGVGEDEIEIEDIFADHLCATNHISSGSASTNKLLQ